MNILFLIPATMIIGVIVFICLQHGCMCRVPKHHVAIIERLGCFHRVCSAGTHFFNPLIERPRTFLKNGKTVSHLNMQSETCEVEFGSSTPHEPKQSTLTGTLAYRIIDPIQALHRVEDLPAALF